MEIEWSKSLYQFNEEATLTIKASPKSLCSISVVNELAKIPTNNDFNIKSSVKNVLDNEYRDIEYTSFNCRDYDNDICAIYRSESDTDIVWAPTVSSDYDTFDTLQVYTASNFICVHHYRFNFVVGLWIIVCY